MNFGIGTSRRETGERSERGTCLDTCVKDEVRDKDRWYRFRVSIYKLINKNSFCQDYSLKILSHSLCLLYGLLRKYNCRFYYQGYISG